MKNNFLKNKLGLTLIELMMAMVILVIGMGGVSLLFMKVWKNNAYTLETGRASMAASQGIEKIVSYLRSARQGDNGAYTIQSADDNEFTLYADYDKDEIAERLHIYKSGSSILMGVTDPAATFPITYPSGDQQIITVVTNVVNGSDAPIFYYYDNQYAGDPDDEPIDTPAVSSDVRLVKIYLQISIKPGSVPNNIEMQSFVEMRNLNDYDRA